MESNNMKAMREALSDIIDKINRWSTDGSMEYWQYSQLFDLANDALALPCRQCDVGTAEEQTARYDKFCHANRTVEKCCTDCPALGVADCELAWAQMPYEEGGAK